MGSWIALFVYVLGIAGLFFLDRDSSARPSKALWLPVIWLWINGSRPLSAWLGMGLASDSPGQLPASSLLDQFVAGLLMVFGFIVIFRRRRDVIPLLRASRPIALYFSFCLVSVLWSDFPGWAFKRWVRAVGDLAMVMIIVSDPRPIAALRRFFSRVGFVLLPMSLLLIKYFPNLGHAYDIWGLQMNIGVATDKNMLGVLTYVLALGTLWQVLELLRNKGRPNRGRHLVAQITLLSFGITLLFTAHSATSGACFTLGAGLMIISTLPPISHRRAAVHALIFAILLVGGVAALLGGEAEVANSMGRRADLTGRTEVWKLLIPMAPNPIIGAGFETFWIGPRLQRIWSLFYGVNESHNGYLEVYLNLGLLGVSLVAAILLHGYRAAVNAFRRDSTIGSLLLAYVLTSAIYSITEAGFRMLDPIWICLLLSVVSAKRVTHLGATDLLPGIAARKRELGEGPIETLPLRPAVSGR